ncbi:MAG: hypothetical protein KAW94_01335 [Candidatus Thorarchaeota archaeon]|nr:hypothetical protein [Candidatus Thorarchaeota archaeon]
MMGTGVHDDVKATESSADPIRLALILGIPGVIIMIATHVVSALAMMMFFDGLVNLSELGVMMYHVYQVAFVGSVLVTVGFIGLVRKHGSTLSWVFLATWLMRTALVYYVTPLIASSPYYGAVSFVWFFAITLANGYVLWTINQRTVHPPLTIMLIVGWLVGPSIITILTSLLLEVIWPYESGMAYLMYSSTNTPVYAFTSILTLLLFVMEIRSLNQIKYLGSEIQNLSP